MQSNQCQFNVLLKHNADPGVVFATVACGCWKCPSCATKRLKPAWVKHLSSIMLTLRHVYCSRVDGVDDFEALAKRIRRRGGNYVRIRKNKQFVVYSDVETDDSERFCRHDAKSVITRDVNAIQSGDGVRRPVSTSRRWKMPKQPPSGYTRLTNKKTTKESVKKAAAKFGAPTYLWKPKDAVNVLDGLRVDASGWTPETTAAFVKECEVNYPYEGKSFSTVNSDEKGWWSCQKTVGSRYGGAISGGVP